jgi:hypothetical protein
MNQVPGTGMDVRLYMFLNLIMDIIQAIAGVISAAVGQEQLRRQRREH